MSGELIGVFGAAIALGTEFVLLSRSNRNEMRRDFSLLREEVALLRDQLQARADSLADEEDQDAGRVEPGSHCTCCMSVRGGGGQCPPRWPERPLLGPAR